MYPEDSIMCCLFPNNCNMFFRTPLMKFLDTYGLSSSPWQSTWLSNCLYMIIIIICLLFQKYVGKLILHNNSSEEYKNCVEELLLQKEVVTECIDNDSVFNRNNSDSNEAMVVSRVGQGEPEPSGCPVSGLENKPTPCELENVSCCKLYPA
ncbi:PREDICTED: uncharacterized protein LOC107170651 [Diuraphis noxia]|uniref:uncharacterized protein LOC107170651 n=1 Tax=Diuraphis noxia TaxID=143948 RepID=UPI00076369B6|nr:PREDICTED: uncharacterized protein LOC107170651 [Diuraphis noxia]